MLHDVENWCLLVSTGKAFQRSSLFSAIIYKILFVNSFSNSSLLTPFSLYREDNMVQQELPYCDAYYADRHQAGSGYRGKSLYRAGSDKYVYRTAQRSESQYPSKEEFQVGV